MSQLHQQCRTCDSCSSSSLQLFASEGSAGIFGGAVEMLEMCRTCVQSNSLQQKRVHSCFFQRLLDHVACYCPL